MGWFGGFFGFCGIFLFGLGKYEKIVCFGEFVVCCFVVVGVFLCCVLVVGLCCVVVGMRGCVCGLGCCVCCGGVGWLVVCFVVVWGLLLVVGMLLWGVWGGVLCLGYWLVVGVFGV
jgi:hypothetical protein